MISHGLQFPGPMETNVKQDGLRKKAENTLGMAPWCFPSSKKISQKGSLPIVGHFIREFPEGIAEQLCVETSSCSHCSLSSAHPPLLVPCDANPWIGPLHCHSWTG
eukprot:g21261.t1